MKKLFSILNNPKSTCKIICWLLVIAEIIVIISVVSLVITANSNMFDILSEISTGLFVLCSILVLIPYICQHDSLIGKQDNENHKD